VIDTDMRYHWGSERFDGTNFSPADVPSDIPLIDGIYSTLLNIR